MRIFGRPQYLLNTADKGGPGAAPGAPADATAQIAAALAALNATMADLPKQIEAAANKAVHGAFAKQRKDSPPPATPPAGKPASGDDEDDDLDDEQPPAAGQPAKGAAPGDAKLARKLKQIERERAAEKAEREKEKAEAAAKAIEMQRKEDRTALTAALTGKVRPELLEAAVALHFDSKKRVVRDEDDAEKRVWRDGDDVMTLEEGVSKWLGSSEGKAYVPAADVKGSGNKGGSAAVGADGKRVFSDADLPGLLAGLGSR